MHLDRFSNFLLSLGIAKPRLKITPVFPVGRMAQAEGTLLTQETLHGFDYPSCIVLKHALWRQVASIRARSWQGWRSRSNLVSFIIRPVSPVIRRA